MEPRSLLLFLTGRSTVHMGQLYNYTTIHCSTVYSQSFQMIFLNSHNLPPLITNLPQNNDPQNLPTLQTFSKSSGEYCFYFQGKVASVDTKSRENVSTTRRDDRASVPSQGRFTRHYQGVERLQELWHHQGKSTPGQAHQAIPMPRLYRQWKMGEEEWKVG